MAEARRREAWLWLWLGAALALQVVSNGRWIVPWAAWAAPAAWLVFLERAPAGRGLALVGAGHVAASIVLWWGIIPAPGALYFAIAGAYGLISFVPYLVHRAAAPRLEGIAATLPFPLSWVALDFVIQRWATPYGSWGSVAYTQVGHEALVQLASVTGIAGITFLIAWFGAVAAGVVGRRSRPSPRRDPLVAFGLVLSAALLFGHLRLEGSVPVEGPIRVAGLVPEPSLAARVHERLGPVQRNQPGSLDALSVAARQLNDDLFDRSGREAAAGARLVAWSETAGRILDTEEPLFLERAGRLARQHGIVLIVAYGVFAPGGDPSFQNKLAALTPDGALAWEFHKAHPVAGAESSFVRAGDGVVPRLDAAFGRLGAVICHDLDFPALVRQASSRRIGLLIGPSADWALIAGIHADMARLRAVESGAWLFRPTEAGRSIAVDPYGRLVADVDGSRDAVVAHVGATRAWTLYGALGDWFAWLCLLGTGVVLSGRWAAIRSRAPRGRPRDAAGA